MICKDCANARRYSTEAVFCVQYGMILSNRHECGLPGAKEKAADDGASADPQPAEKGANNELYHEKTE